MHVHNYTVEGDSHLLLNWVLTKGGHHFSDTVLPEHKL